MEDGRTRSRRQYISPGLPKPCLSLGDACIALLGWREPACGHNQFSGETKAFPTKPAPTQCEAAGFAKRSAGTRDTHLSPPRVPRRPPKAGHGWLRLPEQGRPAQGKEELQGTSELPKAISRGL